MLNGGNAKLREFFETYNVPRTGQIINKYKTKAGIFYRERVHAPLTDDVHVS
jgi:hypothetical protein